MTVVFLDRYEAISCRIFCGSNVSTDFTAFDFLTPKFLATRHVAVVVAVFPEVTPVIVPTASGKLALNEGDAIRGLTIIKPVTLVPERITD